MPFSLAVHMAADYPSISPFATRTWSSSLFWSAPLSWHAELKAVPAKRFKTGLANWANDKYLLAPGHQAAQKKLLDILTASPQDLTHDDYARPTQAALPHLREILVPTLLLTGDADIPDVRAHAGVIEARIRNSRRVVVTDAGRLMYLEKPDEFTSLVVGFMELNRR